MSYYRKLERGLEEWSNTLEEILEIIEKQSVLRATIKYKSDTCCDKIKKILKGMKEIKEEEIIVEID